MVELALVLVVVVGAIGLGYAAIRQVGRSRNRRIAARMRRRAEEADD